MSRPSEATTVSDAVGTAERAVRMGEPVCIHDAPDREGETDLIYPAGAITPEAVARLRNDAGGLICVAISHEVAQELSVPFLADVIDHPAVETEGLPYDDRSSFSLPVNHRDTRTGITDQDRTTTITALADAATRPTSVEFAEWFRSPGHVSILRGAPGLLDERRGHTEFALELAKRADISPAMVVCEMLEDHSGTARSPESARAYANRHGIPFLDGHELTG